MSIEIQPQKYPLPLDLKKEFPDPSLPWKISPRIFGEMQSQGKVLYRKVQVLPTDPEWRAVWRLFHYDKPRNYGIGKIYCVYERHQQQLFEMNLSSIEREAETFPPTWDQEPRADQRALAIERWRQTSQIFSPFQTLEPDGRKRAWNKTKILPLWHGSSASVCDSICKSGFVFFGKTSLGKTGGPTSTDEGFFGSGIYFTNSARYSGDIYSSGHLVLSWVSMREPFPVVGDPDQKDMKGLKAKGAYKDYNAHYVPVTSRNPADPLECMYYPTQKGEDTHCDEIVVFHKSQALPRFWVELNVETPLLLNPSDIPQCVEELTSHLFKLLANQNVDRDQKLRKFLEKELEWLLILPGDDYLEEKHEALYAHMTQLINTQGKVNRGVVQTLVAPSLAPSSPSFSSSPHQLPPKIAFGAADWNKYFGDIGVEPPLPANIEEILNKPCIFWPDKKVGDTHLLVLVPNTVNGKPFHLNALSELIQNPKSGGHKTKYSYYSDDVKKELGEKSVDSHWVLMTRDVIPGSRDQTYDDQKELVQKHAQKSGIRYELPMALEAATAVLMHYVKTGEPLYTDGKLGKEWTYTRCQEKVDNNKWPAAIGGFSSGGLSVYRNWYDSSFDGVGCLWKF